MIISPAASARRFSNDKLARRNYVNTLYGAKEGAKLTDLGAAEIEEAIKVCVRGFYGKARQDPLLGPIFNSTVEDWDVHLRAIANFWSKALLQTDRYNGSPFVLRRNLPV